jgi:hypothetical protein
MAKLEELERGMSIKGILPDQQVMAVLAFLAGWACLNFWVTGVSSAYIN